ncbi:MAG: beta-N-acetylhexosaminidase, partial [Gammaproteobacteria bacterium]|nr:beta-N-acetylhexosaminidase [Gammaproteobacteria bacterium]
MALPLGPVMLDVEGHELTAEDKELLAHPSVGGLILFARNFDSVEQVTQLVKSIRAARKGELIIAVDHEGGRVQRFREGFTKLPTAQTIGSEYAQAPKKAKANAKALGLLLALELRSIDIDLAFAPVLDLDYGCSSVIGDRAWHQEPDSLIALTKATMAGMRAAGMAATGKHYPGHGGIEADSHLELPVDDRSFIQLQKDIQPFKALIEDGLESIMPAHVLYPQIDPEQPAGFSAVWTKGILRQELGFDGVVFSDDLSMAGAAASGNHADRARLALEADCDVALVCNDRAGTVEIIDSLGGDCAPSKR